MKHIFVHNLNNLSAINKPIRWTDAFACALKIEIFGCTQNGRSLDCLSHQSHQPTFNSIKNSNLFLFRIILDLRWWIQAKRAHAFLFVLITSLQQMYDIIFNSFVSVCARSRIRFSISNAWMRFWLPLNSMICGILIKSISECRWWKPKRKIVRVPEHDEL